MKKVAKEKKAISKGISAPPSWWEVMENAAEEIGMSRSTLVRVAVNEYLKGGGMRKKPELLVTTAA